MAQQQVARDRVGAYGCSDGGCLAFRVAFQAHEVFKAVAPASGWSDMTATTNRDPSVMLNTPWLDPEAFAALSATPQAHPLAARLLIPHNRVDRAVP